MWWNDAGEVYASEHQYVVKCLWKRLPNGKFKRTSCVVVPGDIEVFRPAAPGESTEPAPRASTKEAAERGAWRRLWDAVRRYGYDGTR